MSKELYVTSTPHETKLAVVEDDQLVEVFFERENEYTLAGSIYKGKVTRVLPGMQSAFVEIGLERDAFLYVTDFLEEVEEDDAEPIKQVTEGGGDRSERPERSERSDRGDRSDRPERGGRGDRGRDRGGRHRRSGRPQAEPLAAAPAEGSFTIEHDSTQGLDAPGFDEPFDQEPLDQDSDAQPLDAVAPAAEGGEGQEAESRGPRRWRGRRGRRRGRSGVPEAKFAQSEGSESAPIEAAERIAELTPTHDISAEDDEDDSQSAMLGEQGERAPQVDAAAPRRDERHNRPRGDREDRPREGRDRQGRGREGRPQEDRPREGRGREGRPQEDRPREDRGREGRPQEDRPRPQPIVLPGESLAKFGRKNQSDQPKPAGLSEARTQLPRPSTEYTAPTGMTAAGMLAGESLAKYRNRPPQPHAESKQEFRSEATPEPRKSERPRWEEQQDSRRETQKDERREVPRYQAPVAPILPSQELVEEDESIEAGVEGPNDDQPVTIPVPVQTAAAAPVVEEKAEAIEASVEIPAVQQDAPQDFQPEPQQGSGDHRFGQGVVEEETIEEEEHELAPFSEQLEEGEFEELEEETLEHREDDVIAAGDGLAEAVALSRVEGGAETYMVDEDDDDEEEDEEGDEADTEGDDEEDEEGDEDELQVASEADLAEAEAYGDEAGDESDAAVDPEDPNYAGRAEHRTPAGTAAFQQRAERGNAPGRPRRDRGDRGRRGGRPPMRRGGPRRNTPRGPMPQIGELLKEGQEILVQIAKEPMAKKGARITSHIALPGRFLVFMPTVNHTGVSRKIGSDEERQRLKRILLSEKGQSNGGFIVRTAAAGASEEDLRADIRFLINLWNEIKQRAETSKGPTLIYHDLNLVERILRDQVTANFSHIWVDTEAEYERILRFASRFQPSLVKRVKLYTKDTPLFEQFNIQDEINKALKSKVWLKSGGYIVINQTEALVAIDINTGKYVGKTGRLEDTIVKTNLDAIKEIVRQIRLRDLGGIIIIDFIDMDERKNRQKVMQALEAELKNDRSPSKVLQFNDFGLVAITRKRVKQSLERTLSTPCTYCTGTGMIKSVATACNEIYVEMRKMNRHLEGSQIMLRVNPEVAKALKENQGRWLVEMEELTGKSIIVKSDPAQHQEQFEIH